MFGSFLLLACTVMQVYVFWRAASVPLLARLVSRKTLFSIGVVLWATFVLTHLPEYSSREPLLGIFELIGMDWLGILFLASVCLLVVELVTGLGFLLPKLAPSLRGLALLAGVLLSVIALVQGMRPPIIRDYEVRLGGLPTERDGTVVAVVSDLHLGSLLGESWLAARVTQIKDFKPDMIVLLGDLVEGHGQPMGGMIPIFRRLSAPLGVWAVSGNHESHSKGTDNQRLLQEAGFQVLQNRWAEVRPGLILAGVDDLTGRRRSGQSRDVMGQSLAGRPPGATILLSHTPWQAEDAASAGACLMLSGHTHGGQIWPFSYLVQLRYPLLEGRYEVDGMPVIVSRGTGTWGPRMRLWRPGEILRITLRTK